MSLVDIVRSASGMHMEDEDGQVETLELSPGLLAQEFTAFQKALPCPVPQYIREYRDAYLEAIRERFRHPICGTRAIAFCGCFPLP